MSIESIRLPNVLTSALLSANKLLELRLLKTVTGVSFHSKIVQ